MVCQELALRRGSPRTIEERIQIETETQRAEIQTEHRVPIEHRKRLRTAKVKMGRRQKIG